MTLSSNLSSWKRFSTRQNHPDWFRGPLCLLLNGYRGSFEGKKQPQRELNQSPISSAEIRNGWGNICIPLGVYRKSITFQPVDRELDKMRIKRHFAYLRTFDAMFYIFFCRYSSMLQVARLGIARFSLSRFFATYFLHFALIFLNRSNLGKTKLRKMFRLSKHCYWTYIKKKGWL